MAIYLQNGIRNFKDISQLKQRKTALFGFRLFEQRVGERRSVSSYGPHDGKNLGSYVKFAFNSVYLPPHVADPKYEKRILDSSHTLPKIFDVLCIFFGYEYIAAIESPGWRYGVGFLYTLMLGPVFMFLLNTATLFTEFLPKLLSEMLGCGKDRIRSADYTDEDWPKKAEKFKEMPWRAQVAYGVLRFFEVFFETWFVLGRIVTSPMHSFLAGWNSHYIGLGKSSKVLGIFSLLGSLTIYAGLFLVAGPLLALASMKMGFSFVPMSHFNLVNAVAEPVMTLLTTHLGFTASLNLLGAVASAVLGTLICLIQGAARFWLATSVSNKFCSGEGTYDYDDGDESSMAFSTSASESDEAWGGSFDPTGLSTFCS